MLLSLTNDEREVFVAYRELFKGENAKLRKPKAVKRLIGEHQKGYEGFIKRFKGIDGIAAVLRPLLELGAFGPTITTRKMFSTIVNTSIPQAQQSYHRPDDFLDKLPTAAIQEPEKVVVNACGRLEIRSLYPSFVPFHSQHYVLTSVLRLLEECCFDFTSNRAPSLLGQHRWDCPESVELNKWSHIILGHLDKLPAGSFDLSDGVKIREVLAPVNAIRHTVVYRIRTSSRELSRLIESAAAFAKMLRDTDGEARLRWLHTELDRKIKAQEHEKHLLQEKLTREFGGIYKAHKALDEKQRKAVDTLFVEDRENMSRVGLTLEESVREVITFPSHDNKVDEKQSRPLGHSQVYKNPTLEIPPDNNQNAPRESQQVESSTSPSLINFSWEENNTEMAELSSLLGPLPVTGLMKELSCTKSPMPTDEPVKISEGLGIFSKLVDSASSFDTGRGTCPKRGRDVEHGIEATSQ
ncbi:hypothetical protein FQN54_000585 [Arachnomyces sp. PD_36]|nr:hypothetical protein FQN54_000585 [Arachnomyces sp. PD_36]